MHTSAVVRTIPVALVILGSAAKAEDLTRGPDSLGALKRLRTLEQIVKPPGAALPSSTSAAPPATIWTLSPDITKQSSGTFGIDISFWDTVGCKFTWPTLVNIGVRYVYDEVTRGADVTDPSVVDAWNDLEHWHTSKQLYRGAYHFLMPNSDLGVDPTAQANAFLGAIGAVNGKIPAELPPIIDIEPTHTHVTEGTDEFNKCQAAGYVKLDKGKYYCDEWYTYITQNKRQNIVGLAQKFAAAVKAKTNQDVMIYSGIGAWEEVMGTTSGVYQPLLTGRAIWMSRYTTAGSNEWDPAWGAGSWNVAWNMPTMFGGASYPPPPNYNVPDFWQFAQFGQMTANPSSCADFQGNMDLNYVPVKGAQFEKVFGIQ